MFLMIFSFFKKMFFSFYHTLWKKNNKIMVSQNKKPNQSNQNKNPEINSTTISIKMISKFSFLWEQGGHHSKLLIGVMESFADHPKLIVVMSFPSPGAAGRNDDIDVN